MSDFFGGYIAGVCVMIGIFLLPSYNEWVHSNKWRWPLFPGLNREPPKYTSNPTTQPKTDG
jgi:hypothetical protein